GASGDARRDRLVDSARRRGPGIVVRAGVRTRTCSAGSAEVKAWARAASVGGCAGDSRLFLTHHHKPARSKHSAITRVRCAFRLPAHARDRSATLCAQRDRGGCSPDARRHGSAFTRAPCRCRRDGFGFAAVEPPASGECSWFAPNQLLPGLTVLLRRDESSPRAWPLILGERN